MRIAIFIFKLAGWLVLLMLIPVLIHFTLKFSISVFLLAIVMVLATLLYSVLVSPRVRKFLSEYGSLVAIVSLFVTLLLFIVERVQEDRKIETLFPQENSRNAQFADEITQAGNRGSIFWQEFSTTLYRQNWNHILKYHFRCKDFYVGALEGMDTANNLLESMRYHHLSRVPFPSRDEELLVEQASEIKDAFSKIFTFCKSG